MKKTKVLSIAAAVMMMAAGITACGGQEGGNAAPTSETGTQTTQGTAAQADMDEAAKAADADKKITGTITMAGSTSMEKLANAVSEAFMNKYPGTTVTAEFIGSGAGVEQVLAGTVDIGNSSRALKDSEKENGAVENIVAIDGIAVILDKENTVTDLTREQLTAIYKGEITNWSELGGENQPIVVVGRESGSGTRGAFEEILDIADACVYSNELDNTGAVVAKVASTKGAIGYVSLDVVDDTVTAVKLEGVEATADNIIAGDYFLSRPFVMATKGEIGEQSEAVQALFEYLASEEGIALIKQVGLIPVQ